MKLIVAIIQDEDVAHVVESLNEARVQVTKLATKGGFLSSKNTTLLAGVESDRVKETVEIIEKNSKVRLQKTSIPSTYGSMNGLMMNPVDISVGGGTIFVLDVEQFYKF
ncbi:MAG: cyclic-di-AMP receptor [Bacillota bacterium]